MTPTQTLTARLLRRAPILLIALAAIMAFVFFRHLVSLNGLEQHRHDLLALVEQHYLAASLGFIVIYTGLVVISIPGSAVVAMAGGFLFGLFPGVVYNVIAATTGAVIVFLAARSGFGHELAERIETRGGAVARMQQALKEHQVTVLLSMRLIPVLPLLVSNILPALVGVRFWTFAITTFVGIIPADIIYTQLGAGLGAVFARGEHPNLHILFTPEFGLPLLGLAALSFAPLLVKLYTKRKG
ncbi:MAG: TVP38/TMEM64 family protein [Pseudomonadota bacterium]